MQRQAIPRLVAIGGGPGLSLVLNGLAEALQQADGGARLRHSLDHLTGIVTVTGAPGAASFPPGGYTPVDAELRALFRSRGHVYPITPEDVMLRAEFASGEWIAGDSAIRTHGGSIRRIELARHVRPAPEALRALINADLIVVGPGRLHTSVLPSLLVDGVASTLSAVRGIRVYVAPLATERAAAGSMSLDDELAAIRAHTGHDLFDIVLINRTPPDPRQLAWCQLACLQPAWFEPAGCRRSGDEPFECGRALPAAGAAHVIEADLADVHEPQFQHDSRKLAALLLGLAGTERVR